MAKPELIRFPTKKPKPKNKVTCIDGVKYFNEQQIKLLRRTVRDKATLDYEKGNVTGVKEWMVIDLLTMTGVRVAEAANIRGGDFKCGYGESELFIRYGKGCRSRTIQIPQSLKKHGNWFMNYKKQIHESVNYDSHLFIGQRGPWTSQAIQQIVKKWLKHLGLYENGKSVHAIRHSYAVALYKRQRDLRAVQKQLGHASIQTTQIYADVTKEDIQNQIKNFWN